ncbi:MAG TPA: alpha/beta hydrolase [Nocardioides sp.]|nr:alpha/beta hydrolase [Nocardioides sp.]
MTSTTTTTGFATSADGTRIAYEVTGSGPALVLVDGALCHRGFGPARPTAAALAKAFTVTAYDRRGRGESGAGESPYSLDREIEDLAAVVEAAGGRVSLLGISSGAALALEAVRRGMPVERLATYEAPFILDGTHAPRDPRLAERMQRLVDEGRRGDAVRLFMRTVGAPAFMIAVMRLMPAWKKLVAVAHTLPYDLAIVGPHGQGRPLPAGYYDAVTVPVLVMAGGKSPEYMRNAQAAIADALPDARLEVLPGQTHMVRPKVVAPRVTEFLAG